MNPASPREWLLGTLLTYIPLAGLSAGWIAWRHGGAELAARLVGDAPLADAALGLAVGLAVVVASLGARAFRWGRDMEAALAALLGPLPLPVCAGMALASAVGEELLFRAVLQPAWGPAWATLAFAAAHPPFEKALRPWPLLALAAGALLAWLYAATGSVVAPVAAHLAINLCNLYRIGRSAAYPSPSEGSSGGM